MVRTHLKQIEVIYMGSKLILCQRKLIKVYKYALPFLKFESVRFFKRF